MAQSPHLFVTISAHGFGHAAQTAEVVNALGRRIPGLRVTVRTALPKTRLAARFEGGYDYLPTNDDIGMVMASALDILVEESAQAYAAVHRDWSQQVDEEVDRIQRLAPDLVFTNVSYLPLAAAARLGIPAVSLCSLNWADIYAHYFAHRPEGRAIHGQILAAYNSAAYFLRTEPGMSMDDIGNMHTIGPVARLGTNRRDEINRMLGLSPKQRLILVALGGTRARLPVERWPRLTDVRWLVTANWQVDHPDAFPREALGMHFTDLLRSCDAVIGKPGYGTFTEAACNGVPILYLRRNHWPEETCLVDWLKHHGRCLEIRAGQLKRGDLLEPLETVLAMPAPPIPAPRGAEEAADYIVELLG